MHSRDAAFTPTDRPDPAPSGLVPDAPAEAARSEPPRVIEIGEVTAGIAVPEGRGVRFFSAAPDFDGLDGTVFRSADQAARAARARHAAGARRRSA